MAETRLKDLRRFYSTLDQLGWGGDEIRRLSECDGRMEWPVRGVYFFFEDRENRTDSAYRSSGRSRGHARAQSPIADELVDASRTASRRSTDRRWESQRLHLSMARGDSPGSDETDSAMCVVGSGEHGISGGAAS
jgi:hypothetical protein